MNIRYNTTLRLFIIDTTNTTYAMELSESGYFES